MNDKALHSRFKLLLEKRPKGTLVGKDFVNLCN